MSVHRVYRFCCQNIGRPVRVRTRDGRVMEGTLRRTTPSHAVLVPHSRTINHSESQHVDARPAHDTTEDQPEASEVWFYGGIIVPLAAIFAISVIATRPRYGYYW